MAFTMDNNTRIALVAVIIIVLAGAAYLSGVFSKPTPDLWLAAEVSPSNPHAGEAAELQITVVNSGKANVDSAVLQLSIDGAVAAQKTISVEAGKNASTSIKWIAASNGSHSLRLSVDAGNVIVESNESNNVFTENITVLQREEPDIFSSIPSYGMQKAYYGNASTGGLNQLVGILASGSSNPVFYQSLFNKLHEGHLGLANYENGSEAAALILQSELTQDEFVSAVGSILGTSLASETRIVNGKEIVLIEARDGYSTFCAYSEGGWGKVVYYKRFFPLVDVLNNTFGENTTCVDIIAKQNYNSTNAQDLLGVTSIIRDRAPMNWTTMLEAVMRSGQEKLYARGFNDSNSAFLVLISDSGLLLPSTCPGDLINESNMSICHAEKASLMGSAEMEAFVRKQGQYTIAVFIAPFAGTNIALARSTALQTVKQVHFPGISEYVWGTTPTQLSFCEFLDTFVCGAPTIDNDTLKLNVTLVTTRPVNITGFKCTQENSTPTEMFALNDSISLEPGQTIEIARPCYITGSTEFTGRVMFLQAHLYMNITTQGENESRVVKGLMLLNNLGLAQGGIPTIPGVSGGGT